MAELAKGQSRTETGKFTVCKHGHCEFTVTGQIGTSVVERAYLSSSLDSPWNPTEKEGHQFVSRRIYKRKQQAV